MAYHTKMLLRKYAMTIIICLVSPKGIFADTCLQITLIFQEGLGRRVLKNSATETRVETFFSDTKHNDEKNINHKIGRQSISNDVVDDVSSDETIQIEGVTANRNVKSDLGESPHSQEPKEALKEATNLSTVDAIPIALIKQIKPI